MRGWPIVWVALVGVLFFAPADAVADGAAFAGRDLTSLRSIEQGEQRAAIAHQDGVERLIIAMSLELKNEDRALWVFPLPGDPEQAKLDVLEVFPDFGGRDVVQHARQRIEAFMVQVSATQVYPVLIGRAMGIRRRVPEVAGAGGVASPVSVYSEMPKYGVHAETVTARSLADLAGAGGGASPVTVYSEMRKHGVHAEAVTARSLEDLAGYLRTKQAAVPQEQIATLSPYLKEGYFLVLAWVASREELLEEFSQYGEDSYPGRARWPCLYVEFPTDRAFYPLRATCGYGSSTIPVTLFVMGHVRAKTAPPLAKHLRVSYREQNRFWRTTPRELVAGFPDEDVPYTTITISTRAENFTDDLWFLPGGPRRIKYARMIGWLTSPPQVSLYWLFAVALASYVCAGSSALLLYHRWRGYAQMGFWNLLTFVAFAVRVFIARGEDGKRLPQAGSFIFLFTATYIILTMLAYMALLAPLL